MKRLAQRPAHQASITLPIDPHDAQRVADAEAEVAQARQRVEAIALVDQQSPEMGTLRTELATAVETARVALAEVVAGVPTMTFRFTSCGGAGLRKLTDKHPPTDAQIERAKRLGLAPPAFDVDTLAPVLIWSCLDRIEVTDQEPIDQLTVEGLVEMFGDNGWSQEDFDVLFFTCLELTRARTVIDVGDGRRPG